MYKTRSLLIFNICFLSLKNFKNIFEIVRMYFVLKLSGKDSVFIVTAQSRIELVRESSCKLVSCLPTF